MLVLESGRFAVDGQCALAHRPEMTLLGIVGERLKALVGCRLPERVGHIEFPAGVFARLEFVFLDTVVSLATDEYRGVLGHEGNALHVAVGISARPELIAIGMGNDTRVGVDIDMEDEETIRLGLVAHHGILIAS